MNFVDKPFNFLNQGVGGIKLLGLNVRLLKIQKKKSRSVQS